MVTLTDLCEVMNNWFDTKSDGTKDRHFGTFTVVNGAIDLSGTGIRPGQYYRIIGSVYNDGVWQYPYPQDEEEPDTGDVQNNTDSTDNPDDTVTPVPSDQTETETETDVQDEESLVDEVFEGAIWIMYVPRKVVSLLQEINDWDDVYGPIVASPFNSESFGGYSYYKGYKNTMSNVASSWATKFAEKINKYRKVRNVYGEE